MQRIPLDYEQYRVILGPYGSFAGDISGAFLIPGPCGMELKVLASCGDDEVPWEHVSVSLAKRCPNWPEMCFIKDLFWSEEEVVMQLHPRRSEYVNNHDYCLHLWRPLREQIPTPPKIAV